MTLSKKERKQLQEGIDAFKNEDREAAHSVFLRLLRRHPENVKLLVYAAGTAPSRKQASFYLEKAQSIQPNSIAIEKVSRYIQHLPEEPGFTAASYSAAERRGISRLVKEVAETSPPWWKVALGTAGGALVIASGMLLIVLAYFAYLNILVPRQVDAQVVSLQSTVDAPPSYTRTAFLPSATPEMTVTPAATASPESTVTQTLTAVPSATASVLASKTALQYVPVEFMEYYQNTGKYMQQPVSISGQVVGFGEAMVDGELVFSLLLGVPPDEAVVDTVLSPLLILNIQPDPNLQINALVIIYGLGVEANEETYVQGMRWDGPVFQGSNLEFISP
jgi:hypothetical protein